MKFNHKRSLFLGAGIILILFSSAVFSDVSIANAQTLQNWSDPINLSNSGASTNPLIVTDTDGVIHVIWVDEFDGYKYVESNNGVDWTTPTAITFPFLPEDSLPRFEVTSDGIIHAFWIDGDSSLYYSQTPQATFGSSSWRTRFRLSDSVAGFDISLSNTDGLHVSYVKNEDSESEPAGVYYRRSIRGGSSWSNPQNLFTSQYFRSLTAENAHIRITVFNANETENVYIAWDSRPQKQIFLANSKDGGQTWSEVEQIKGPDESTGYQTPSNVEISTYGKSVLLLWQVGEFSNQCVQYSQYKLNGGDDWGEPIKILDENLGCPEKIEIIPLDQNHTLLFLKIQGRLSFIVWNGNQWSALQSQDELLEFFNPTTFDPILLDCQQISLHESMINLVGCDQGNSGDIWFSSRSLDSVENWYPSLSGWNPTGLITSTEQIISSMTSVAYLNSVHLFWVQSASSQSEEYVPSIQYSRWDDGRWSSPRTIISNLPGKPLQISVINDWEGRLLLVWQDEVDGNIYFSWADSEGANLSKEWIQPEIVPSISQLNSSPDILVDASGRIIITYSVTVNENRGLYIVQSSDLGNSWSSPMNVFDGVSAGWEMIDHPKISLSADGRLHLLFNRYSMRNDDKSMGLYYMQSVDGGITWSETELVSEGQITWSDIYSFDQQTVHRIWQEKNGFEVLYIDQISFDGGFSWGAPVKIIGADEETTQISLAMDQGGNLRLTQLLYGKDTSLQDWKWDGDRWVLQESKELALRGDGTRYSLANSITSDGKLVVSILLENSDLAGDKTEEIWSLHRILDITEIAQDSRLPIIPTPMSILRTTEVPTIVPTLTKNASPLANLNDSPSANRKDLVGWFLVVAILVLAVVIIRPKRKK